MSGAKSFMLHSDSRILIVLHGAIGDVCRALPLAVRIKRAYPQCRISWAVEPKSEGLVRGHSAVDDVIVFDRPQGLRAYWKFVRELRARKFDLVLDLQRHAKSGVTSYFSGASTRWGFHRRDAKEYNWIFSNQRIAYFGERIPKIEHYQKFGDALGLPQLGRYDFGFAVSLQAQMSLEDKLTRIAQQQSCLLPTPDERAILVVGGSWESKCWFPGHFAKLAYELENQFGFTSILVGGGDADERMAKEIQVEGRRVINLVGRTDLADLIALFSNARVAIGADSGPLHIAGAVALPIVVLMGPTDPLRTSPYAEKKYVLQSPVGCAPCYRRICPGLGKLCMESLSPEGVLAAVATVIGSSADSIALQR